MARGPVPITALAAAACVAALVLLPLGAVIARAGVLPALGPGDIAAIRFTLVQATISAVLSVALAIPVARALARRRFPGRGALVLLLGAPFILPVIVAIFGLLAVFGRTGLVSQALAPAGLPALDIYGLHGVVLAHVFFNLPLAVRLVLQGWLDIPAERFRLAATLNLPPQTLFRVVELPMLRSVVPGILTVIFLVCTTSFAVALTLGGGPRATTVELAIYQAFRFDADLGRAAALAVVQLVVTLAAAAVAFRLSLPEVGAGGLDRTVERWDSRHLRILDAGLVLLAALFLLVPVAMIVARGLPGLPSLPATVWAAAARSVGVALASTALTVALALPLALAAGRGHAWIEAVGYLPLAASSLVLGTGLFLLTFPVVDPARLALPVTALVNAALSLPFALRALAPAARQTEARFGALADGLGLSGFARLRIVTLPRLRRPLGFSAGLAAALSMGDLGVIALFGQPDRATLPLQLYRLMSAYRMDQAASAALLLLVLSLAAFWLFDRGGRVDADA